MSVQGKMAVLKLTILQRIWLPTGKKMNKYVIKEDSDGNKKMENALHYLLRKCKSKNELCYKTKKLVSRFKKICKIV